VTVCLDEAAASELALNSYYRYVYEHKPEWQKVLDPKLTGCVPNPAVRRPVDSLV
jgi:hypothetical protein